MAALVEDLNLERPICALQYSSWNSLTRFCSCPLGRSDIEALLVDSLSQQYFKEDV